MKAHLQYLRYVLIHKLYVARAGIAIRGWSPGWLWRLLVHDLSKFRPSEWRPYVTMFYGIKEPAWIARQARRHLRFTVHASGGSIEREAHERAVSEWPVEKKARKAAFDRAWLKHQHRNSHHWQHWLLHEDSGANLLLVPPAPDVDEMIADWLGAGTKVLAWPTFAQCVGETIVWYVANRSKIQLREIARNRVEYVLAGLAADYELLAPALALHEAARTRESLVVR